ncbi:MAG: toll/interleukin-1 receptor domain-containing protein [Acidimicrobiia bacterium]
MSRLAADLDREGITIWYDKKDLRLGQSIVGAINDAIGSARYLLAVLSPNAIRSRWVVEELNAATMRQIASDGTFLIPALIESATSRPC